ncbi:MAG: sensor histidine kinase, partial [Deltaproteobacteria bacterium]
MRRGSLASRLVAANLAPALVALAAIGFAAWSVARRALEDELGRRLSSVAGAAGVGLPIELLLSLGPGDEGSRTYARAKGQLSRIVALGELRRLAVFTPDGRIVADSSGAPIGADLPELARDRLELGRLWQGEPTASRVLFRGLDGRFYKSGYAPLTLDGKVVAGAIAEGDASFFSVLGQLRGRLLAVGLLGALGVIVVSLLLARALTRPVGRLVAAARRIGGGDLVTPVEPPARAAPGDELAFLARTLEEMRRDLEARDRQLQMMLAGIAHEIRNPLGGIELFAGLLRESLPSEGEAAGQVRRIQQELGHLTRVVEDFLDYARRPGLSREPIVAAELAAELAGLIEPELERRRLRLVTDTRDPAPFQADPSQLRRALLNLLKNAAQVSPEGAEIRLSFERAGAELQWSVEDQGPGIPEAQRETVFEPFFTTREK